MKKTLFLAFILPVSFTFGQGSRMQQMKDAKVFEVKSGKVEYKLDGTAKGTKTLWWDDYGRLQCEHQKTTTKMMGFSSTEETLTIRTKEWIYTVNLKDKTGTKTRTDEAFGMADAMTGGMTDAQLKQFGDDMMKNFDGKEIGTETILGRSCKVIQIGKLNSKVWGYKNVTLKLEVNMGGMGTSTEEATSFDENISVPASKFQPPSGIEYRDMTEMMKNIQGMPGMDEDDDDDAE